MHPKFLALALGTTPALGAVWLLAPALRPLSAERGSAALAAQLPDPAPRFSTSPELRVSVLREHSAESDEHLGIGLCAIGDLDGDGLGDYLVGATSGGYVTFGPGFVQAYSAASGARLYRVTGRGGKDGFGDTLCALGDVNGDGIDDFAVGARRFDEYRGYVTLFSGSDGAPLLEIEGDAHEDSLGEFLAAPGDVNGDGRADVVAGSARSSAAFCGRTGERLYRLDGAALGRTADANDDGLADWIAVDAGGREPRAHLIDVISGKTVRTFELQGVERSSTSWSRTRFAPAGDLDGDGYSDLLAQCSIYADAYSGRDGACLVSWWSDVPTSGEVAAVLPVGDRNADGHADFLVEIASSSRHLARFDLRSGRNGALLGELQLNVASGAGVTRTALLPDLDGDGLRELVLANPESALGSKCSGGVWVLSLAVGQDR